MYGTPLKVFVSVCASQCAIEHSLQDHIWSTREFVWDRCQTQDMRTRQEQDTKERIWAFVCLQNRFPLFRTHTHTRMLFVSDLCHDGKLHKRRSQSQHISVVSFAVGPWNNDVRSRRASCAHLFPHFKTAPQLNKAQSKAWKMNTKNGRYMSRWRLRTRVTLPMCGNMTRVVTVTLSKIRSNRNKSRECVSVCADAHVFFIWTTVQTP